MRTDQKNSVRSRLVTAGLLAGVAGLAFSGGVVTNTMPVLAEPVTVEAPAVNPGFADVVEQVTPAVVSVRVRQTISPVSNQGFSMPFENLPEDHPMRRFFDFDFPGEGNGPEQRSPRQSMGQGSGFFISGDGYIVTNNHVVEHGSEYTVVLDDGTELDAELIGTDRRTDLALLKVEPLPDEEFTYVRFADEADVRVGDWVVAVGNPFGLGGSVTAGIVSALGRDIGAGPYDDFLQIDAAVNRGNSGGPAFNLSGEVVGVNTAIFSPSGGNVGIAFAIPASTAKSVIAELRNEGEVERGWLGVQIGPVTEDIAEAVGLDEATGSIVTLPESETPASEAGIETGDVILEVNGQSVPGPKELSREIAAFDPGTKIDVTVWRDDEEETITVELGDLDTLDERLFADRSDGSGIPVDPSSLSGYGLTLTPAEEGSGVVVTDVDPSSEAAEKGIEPGDVITSVNGTEVETQGDVEAALEDASESGRSAALFQVRRQDQNRFVALPIAKS